MKKKSMTVADIRRVIEKMRDDEEIKFVSAYIDRDGFPAERIADVIAIVREDAKLVDTGNCGIKRYERVI